MKPPAVVLERRDEGIQAAPDTEIGRRRRGLHLPHPFDQHLAVVQAAQPLLIALERAQVRRQLSGAGHLALELEGVAKLLHSNPDRVQPLWQIHRARVLDRLFQGRRAARQPGANRPSPPAGGRPASAFRLVHGQLIGDLVELGGDPAQVRDRQLRQQVVASRRAPLGDRRRDSTERFLVVPARLLQLVELEHQHVELAGRTEALGDLAEPAADLGRDVAVELEDR